MASPERTPNHGPGGTTPRWHVLADDLTGAADTASAFRARGYRSVLLLEPDADGGEAAGVVAVDLDVREEAEGSARVGERVRRSLPLVGDRRVYLKIDSTLRGPVRTLLAAYLGGGDLSPGASLLPLPHGGRGADVTSSVDRIEVVQADSAEPSPLEGEGGAERRARGKAFVCPAFPAQGRITRNRVQYVHGIPVELEGENGTLTADLSEVFGQSIVQVGDAASDEHLDDWAKLLRMRPETLCVGSGGLAAALARQAPRADPVPDLPAVERVMVLSGSPHPTTREQVRAFTASPRDDRWLLLQAPPEVEGPLDVGHARTLAEAAIQIADIPVPTAWVLTGGATARCFLEAAGVSALEVGGEVAPGIPWMIARDGRIAGSPVVTKSGGFGGRDVLHEILSFLL